MFFLGMTLGGSTGVSTETLGVADTGDLRETNASILAKLDALSREVRQLRDEQADDARNARRRERVDPAMADLRVASPTELSAGEREILERLKALELRSVTFPSPQVVYQAIAKIERPADMPVRDFLATLKSVDNSKVQQAHAGWSQAKVQEAYGLPDAIEDRGSYIEWIYYIEDEPADGSKRAQFDFHFTNDRCNVAH